MLKLILFVTVILFLLNTSVLADGTTYYVDSIAGNDDHSGTSMSAPWKSLSKVSSLTLKPGDKLLFRRNCQFRGERLAPNGDGMASNPITVDAYGTGNKPVIIRDTMSGAAGGAIRLIDRSYYLIQNLEIQSPQDHGVVLHGCSHVTVQNCDFTNIAYLPPGQMQGTHEAWSVIIESGSTDGSYNTIDHCTFKKCSMGVMQFAGDHLLVQNCYLYLVDGLGVIYGGHCVGKTVTNSRIKACVFDYTDVSAEGWNPVMFGGTDNCYQEYCETKNTPLGKVDHQVYDFDTNCKNSYIQYNYSHDNPGELFHSYWCGNASSNSACYFRYNISVNDRTIACHVGLCQQGTPSTHGFQMYNNLFYNLAGTWGPTIGAEKLADAVIRNNIFYKRQGHSVVSLPAGASNNCYFNCPAPPGEPGAIEADPQFVDPRHVPGELRIASTSPCKDAGAKIENNGGKDFFGNSLSDGAPDIGASEWVGPPAPAVPNLASHCVVKSSSSYSAEKSGWSESALVDGSVNTVPNTRGWRSSANDKVDHTEWVTLDLESDHIINRVLLYPRNDSGYVGVSFPKDFQIKTSLDGKEWTVACSQEDYKLPGNSPQYFDFASRKARYVNLTMTSLRRDLDGKYVAALAEMEVLNDASPVPPSYPPSGDLALNKDVMASSSIEDLGIYSFKVKLVDGLRSSVAGSMGWSSCPSSAVTRAEWVTVDLGAVYSVSRVDLYPRNDAGNIGSGFPIDFRIQISTDNMNWKTVSTIRGYKQPTDGLVQTFPFATTSARYVRVNATKLRSDDKGNRTMAFAELEVY